MGFSFELMTQSSFSSFTGENTLIMMTKDFDPISEFSIHSEEFGSGKLQWTGSRLHGDTRKAIRGRYPCLVPAVTLNFGIGGSTDFVWHMYNKIKINWNCLGSHSKHCTVAPPPPIQHCGSWLCEPQAGTQLWMGRKWFWKCAKNCDQDF